jgi:hypothetical protein
VYELGPGCGLLGPGCGLQGLRQERQNEMGELGSWQVLPERVPGLGLGPQQ